MEARRLIYGVSLWVFLATIGLTLAAILIPEWITWTTPESSHSKRIHYTYGLHSRCSSLEQTCTPFLSPSDHAHSATCAGPAAPFCTAWRTAGFLMSLAVALELATLVAYTLLLAGGKQQRERGWPLLIGLLAACGTAQCAAMALVVDLWRVEPRFAAGWVLGQCVGLCAAAWALQVLIGVGIGVSMVLVPQEGGYELLVEGPSRRG